jgi:hypothetical protein
VRASLCPDVNRADTRRLSGYTRKTESRRCFGTCAAGIGTSIRQARGCATAVGRTGCTGLKTGLNETENTETDADGAELPCSDAAQQRSASACVTAPDPESVESDLCIGHAPSMEQQAMRASGVTIQPAHKATWLAESANVKRRAGRCLVKRGTVPS